MPRVLENRRWLLTSRVNIRHGDLQLESSFNLDRQYHPEPALVALAVKTLGRLWGRTVEHFWHRLVYQLLIFLCSSSLELYKTGLNQGTRA